MNRDEVIAIANESSNRGGQPRLSAESNRETLIAWLSWCDGNGIWTDEDMLANDMDPMSVEDAWIQVELLIEANQ